MLNLTINTSGMSVYTSPGLAYFTKKYVCIAAVWCYFNLTFFEQLINQGNGFWYVRGTYSSSYSPWAEALTLIPRYFSSLCREHSEMCFWNSPLLNQQLRDVIHLEAPLTQNRWRFKQKTWQTVTGQEGKQRCTGEKHATNSNRKQQPLVSLKVLERISTEMYKSDLPQYNLGRL